MLTTRPVQSGVTLIELAIGLVIVGLLLVMGLPSFGTWLQNSQVRNAAESLQNGLQLARAEAVRRNTAIRFQLADTLTATCALSAAGTTWLVSFDDPTGACNAAASEILAPRVIQAWSAAEGSPNVAIVADQATLVFNGMGRLTPVPAAGIDIAVGNPVGGACKADGGPMRCLRVAVSAGGQIRMCDPALAGGDPRAC